MAILCLLCRSSKCDKYSHTTNNKLQFHRLPNDESLRTSWLDAVKLVLGDQWTLKSRHAYICSEHFLPEDYIPSGCSRRLKPKSVPSQKLAADSDIENEGRQMKRYRVKSPRKIPTILKEVNQNLNGNFVSPSKKLSRHFTVNLNEESSIEECEIIKQLFNETPDEANVTEEQTGSSPAAHPDDSQNVFNTSTGSFVASTPIQQHKIQQGAGLTPDDSEIKEPHQAVPQGRKQLYTDLCKSWNLETEKINRSERPLTCSSFLELCSLEKKTDKTKLKIKKLEEKDLFHSALDKLRIKLRYVQSDLNKTKEKLFHEEKTSCKLKKEATKYKKKYLNAEQRRVRGQKKIRNLTAKLLRRDKKIETLQDAVNHLKDTNHIDEEMAALLSALPPPAKSVIFRAKRRANLQHGDHSKYDPQIRKFSISLYSYSPAAYDYVRKTFLCALPNKSTIGKWLKAIEAEPGFEGEAMDLIKAKALKFKENTGKDVVVNLAVDDMSLMEKLEFDGNKVIGYEDLGPEYLTDEKPKAEKATNACVFMASAINSSWKIPCGYLLIKSLTSVQRGEQLKKCILALEKAGARVESVTFDGTVSNFGMANHLGAKLSSLEDLKTTFPNPADPSRNIHVILDAAHMLKLLRNLLAMEKEKLVDGDGNEIEWKFVERLYELQSSIGLKAGNKLSRRHVEWDKSKMNVRLAAQVCSDSVARTIEELDLLYKDERFQGSAGTVTYLKMVNKVFDLLNSSSPIGRGSKAPLKRDNKDEWMKTFEEAEKYFSTLKITRRPKVGRDGKTLPSPESVVIKSSMKVAVLGIIITMRSVKDMFVKLVEEENLMNYLLTYKLSQDHLEMFFGCIRRINGCNNNPTCRIFKSSYKRMVVKNEIKCSENANAIDISDIKIFHVASSKKLTVEENFLSVLAVTDLIDVGQLKINFMDSGELLNSQLFKEHNYSTGWTTEAILETSVIEYIAGWVVHRISPLLKCETCIKALNGDSDAKKSLALIDSRSRGWLKVPSADVVKIYKLTNQIFLANVSSNLNFLLKKQFPLQIAMKAQDLGLFKSLNDHVENLSPFNSHLNDLVKIIAYFYLKVRVCARISQENGEKVSMRQKLTRTVIFSHQ